MDPFARKGVQKRRHGGHQRLTFAGLELGDAAVVDGDAADDLDVELALADRRLAASRTRANASTSRLLSESPWRALTSESWALDFNCSGFKTS